MNKLEIIYYMDMKTDEVLPLIQKKGTVNSSKFMLDTLNSVFAIFGDGTDNRQDNKVIFLNGYYIDLLKSGCSAKNMERLLREAYYNAQSIFVMDALMEQIEILQNVSRIYNEDKNVVGLKEFFMMPTVQKNVKEYYTRKLRR